MTVSIQYVKMSSNESMTRHTIDKLQKLGRKYSRLIKAEVSFKIDKDPSEIKK